MEKFSKWNDAKGTGVNPFLPPSGRSMSVPTLLVGSLVAIPRLCVVSALLVWLWMGGVVSRWCPRFLRWLTEALPCYLVIFALGFVPEWRELPENKLGRAPDPKKPRSSIQGGDLVLSNCTGPMDVLVLAAQLAPRFAITEAGGNGVAVLSVFDALLWSCGLLRDVSFGKAETVVGAQWSGGPFVVFAEGGLSNNKSVLRFSRAVDVLGAMAVERKGSVVHTVAVRHRKRGGGSGGSGELYQPLVLPAGNVWWFFFRTAALLDFSGESPCVVVSVPATFSPQPTLEDPQKLATNARAVMCRILGCPQTAFAAPDFFAFRDAWEGVAKKDERSYVGRNYKGD